MASYTLSPAAQTDLEAIWDYSAKQWGLLTWVVLNLAVESKFLEPLLKIALPLYLMATFFAAWMTGLIFRRSNESETVDEPSNG